MGDYNVVDLCCYTKEEGPLHIPKEKSTKREESKEKKGRRMGRAHTHSPGLERRPLGGAEASI